MPMHLLESTVDITSTVDFREKSVEINRQCGFIPKKIGRPLTYGPIRCEKWSRTHIRQEVMVPCVVKNGPNSYPNIDTYPPIYLGRSVTVDIDTGSMPIH